MGSEGAAGHLNCLIMIRILISSTHLPDQQWNLVVLYVGVTKPTEAEKKKKERDKIGNKDRKLFACLILSADPM